MEKGCSPNKTKEIDYNRQHDLTLEELKSYPMFVHFSDEQVLEIIDTIRRFTEITYEFYQRRGEKDLDLDG